MSSIPHLRCVGIILAISDPIEIPVPVASLTTLKTSLASITAGKPPNRQTDKTFLHACPSFAIT